MSEPAAFRATYSDEEWRPIPNFVGKYEVSSHGRVRTVPHRVMRKDGRPMLVAGRILKPSMVDGRYPNVVLSDMGEQYSYMVHSIVALVFLGPRPQSHEICHNDGNRQNCRADNLRYATRAENHADKRKHGTVPLGEASVQAKLTAEQVANIRRLSAAGCLTQRAIAEMHGITQSNVSAIVLRKSWGHI